MDSLNVNEMFEMQNELHKRYEGEWIPRVPENAHYKLLWGIGEMSEIIDVFKKHGWQAAVEPGMVRDHLMEETADVLMYLWDMLYCMGITPEEFSEIYRKKHAFNMKRVYGVDRFTEDE